MFTLKIEGGDELAAALKSLPDRVSKKAMREALLEAAEPIRAAASRLAPRRAPEPDIADHIVIAAGRSSGVSVAVGPSKDFHYGLYLEYGTVKMSAHPFLRPAFDSTRQKVIDAMTDELWRLLAGRGILRSVTSDSVVKAPGGSGLL